MRPGAAMRPDKARSGEAQLHDMVWAICVAAATHTWYATEWCRQSEWRLVIGQQDRWKWGTIDLLLSNIYGKRRLQRGLTFAASMDS